MSSYTRLNKQQRKIVVDRTREWIYTRTKIASTYDHIDFISTNCLNTTADLKVVKALHQYILVST